MPVLVDSNVILDVLTEDPRWFDWSSGQLAAAAEESSVLYNPIIYAELAPGFLTKEDLDASLPAILERRDLPWDAAFLAGKSFVEYRKRGGIRRAPLPDFYIGAHAAIEGLVLLTRDPRLYRTYFPRLRVLAPD